MHNPLSIRLVGCVFSLLAAPVLAQSADDPPQPPQLTFAFELRAEVASPVDLGEVTEVQRLVDAADGDARRALGLLELAVDLAPDREGKRHVGRDAAAEVARGGHRRFDRQGEYFYDQVSALHKSIRGSDPDASLYWLMRMLDGGCDPLYVARRMVRVASEDIGNADPRALRITLDAWDALERLGSPEGELALAQAVVFLACAAKSNAVYKAANAARADVAEFGSPRTCRCTCAMHPRDS